MGKAHNDDGSANWTSRNKKKYKCSTKNNIHHFKVIIKKILEVKVKQSKLSPARFREYCRTIRKATSLKKFVDSYSAPWVRSILLESIHNGEFLRLTLTSDMSCRNKVDSAQYLNILFNSFMTGQLERWIIEPPALKKEPECSYIVVAQEKILSIKESDDLIDQSRPQEQQDLDLLESEFPGTNGIYPFETDRDTPLYHFLEDQMPFNI